MDYLPNCDDDDIITSHNDLQHHVITDFPITFERDTGLTIQSCRDIVQDYDSIFHSFSFLHKHLLSLIDSALPCQTFTIKNLTIAQRRDFYIELTEIGIYYTKNRYLDDNRNYCTDICIHTTNIWSVPDYRTNPELAIYQYGINVFNTYYSRIETLLSTYTAPNSNIIVSLENFLEFKIILADIITSYNYNIQYIINLTNVLTNSNNTNTKPPVSSNIKIKYQLADLIFDIKDNLSDGVYKELLENIALIS